jgi:Mrp family chromosome partitioning ATPase/uncharacterized protein involved in exopolysaccharide biosynthesis
LHSLFRKKWLIIFSTIVGIAAGIAFALTIKKTYTSLAQYSTGFTMGQKVKIKSEETFNIFEIDFQFKNVIETFKSPIVLGMVSYKLMLHDLESEQPFRTPTEEQKRTKIYNAVDPTNLRNTLRTKIALMEELSNRVPEERKMRDFIKLYGYDEESLMKKFIIERVQGTDYLNIWFTSENPDLCAFAVNDVGNEFQQFFAKIYSTRSEESAAKLDSLTRQKKAELDNVTKQYEDFRNKLGAPDISGRSVAAMDVVKDATSNWTNEVAKLNGLKSQLSSVNEQLKNMGAVTTSGTNNNAEIFRLRQENNDLASRLASTNDASIQKQIDDNNRKIAQLSSSSSGGTGTDKQQAQKERSDLLKKKYDLEADINATQLNVGLYKQKMEEYESIASKGGGETVLAADFESRIKILNTQYENLLRSQQSAQDMNIAPEINFKQTMIGQPPISPDPSKRLMIVAGAGAAMFAISTLLIILLDLMDGSLKTPSVFLRNTRLKLLGPINHVDLRKKDVATLFDVTNGRRKDDDILFIENVRKLRFEIEQAGKKIFLFTSNKIGEGKTTVMEALANSLSLSRKKVLLIDSNFSNNTLTQKFEAKPMLEKFSVNGERNPNDKFEDIKSETPIPYVELVGCNYGNYTPSEILPKNNLMENLRAIAENYDYVFIEGAALNTHADSKELSKYVDGIISVFSAKSVLRQTDKESIQFLKHTGNKYIGAVLNEVQADNIDL